MTANGMLLRARDGGVIMERSGGLTYSTPILDGHAIYFAEHKGTAIKIPAKAIDSARPIVLWETEPHKDRYYASALHHDGLIYTVTQKQMFSAIDAKTGQVVFSEKLKTGGGTTYASVTLAGEHLYVGSDNGTTLVVKPGKECTVLATNRLAACKSSPVFMGERMYVRTEQHLYCIGPGAERNGGDAGGAAR